MPPNDTWNRQLDTDTRSPAAAPRAPALRVPGFTVFWHPDVSRVGERAPLAHLASGEGVELSRLGPLFSHPGEALRRPLADPHLSRRPIRVRAAGGGLTFDASGGTPMEIEGEAVATTQVGTEALETGVALVLAGRVGLLLHAMPPTCPRLPSFGLVGECGAVHDLRRRIGRASAVDLPVLLRGETGTGKELVARAIHDASNRRRRPFLAVNMGAVPPSLAAAELFGAARGAFTGADRPRSGYFEQSDGGTLFLDEVGDTPAEVQPMLLRVLETGEVQPVGSGAPKRVDVRIVAATDADLEVDLASGRFRAPLLHRLGGYPIELPPLRARRGDIGRLLVHFLRRELGSAGKLARLRDPGPDDEPWLGARAVARLMDHPWPGNVRELLNVARRLAVEAADDESVGEAAVARWLGTPGGADPALGTSGEPPAVDAAVPFGSAAPPRSPDPYRSPDDVTDDEIRSALAARRWRVSPAARDLGISRGALYRRIAASPTLRTAADLEESEIRACHERLGGDLGAMVDDLEVSRRALSRRLRELGLD
ncbi:MAG: sigma-54 dependent transcriptional regulator [Acidobacteriota bacterium]